MSDDQRHRGEEEELTAKQIAEIEAKIQQRRATLLTVIEGRRAEERGTTREVGDEMDDASTEGEAGLNSTLLERESKEVAAIDRALTKMKEGTYGFCEGTGEPIGFARLNLQPTARFSIAWQEELERKKK